MNFWNRRSLKTKLLLMSSFLVLVIGILALNSYFGLHRVDDESSKLAKISLPNIIYFTAMDSAFRSVRIELQTLGLPGLTKAQEAKAIEGVKKFIDIYDENEKKYLGIDFAPGEQEIYEVLHKEWIGFKAIGQRVLDLNAQGTPESKSKMVEIFMGECPESAVRVAVVIDRLMKFHTDMAEEFIKSAHSEVSSSNTGNVLMGLFGVVIGLLAGFVVSNQVSQQISKVANELSKSADSVSTASTQIASSSTDLSQASSEQAASLQQTAASLEEITAMIEKANTNATTSSKTSQESHSKAEEGRQSVEQMLSSMEEISQSNDAIMNQINYSNQELAEIVSMIQNIGNKTKVINEIVFQTKLLSFNASVEAARAGEHGKGFAVVAEEVGNLAQMSGTAAKEISELLEQSTVRVDKIVKETKDKVEALVGEGKLKVESGVAVAKACSDILHEIVNSASVIAGLSEDIAEASKEQSQGVSEINKAMAQLDTVTQQNASASEQAANAGNELSNQSQYLKSAVSDLLNVVNGYSTDAAKGSLTVSSQSAVHLNAPRHKKFKKAA